MNKKKIYKFDNKVKLRTEAELRIRKHEFLKICKILNKLNIRYFLHSGILLGAIREKGFIPWDWDVEIGVYSNEVIPKIELLLSEIKDSNFFIIKYDKDTSTFKLDFKGKLPVDTTLYSILGWNNDKNRGFVWRKKSKIPDHFFFNMKKIKLFNKYHFAPQPINEYLKYMYGNWRKPLRTSDKRLYLTKKFYGTNLVFYFIKKFKKLYRKYI